MKEGMTMKFSETRIATHACLNGNDGYDYAWWEKDAQGIELCKVCDRCEAQKLARYNPWVLSGYDQGDLDESIEES
jgi:hypothetical protein